jgi:ribonuclease R
LIEEAMLAANVCSADFILQAKHPAVFRVHEGPTPEKRETLRNYLKAMGVPATLSENPTPGQYQAIAQASKERPDAQQIHSMLLRSMQQAIYTPMNSGHFGLAYPAYTHFTSPIRRYPDLLVHRVIRSILTGRRYQLPGLPVPGEAHVKLARRLAAQARLKEKSSAVVQKPSAEQQAWEAAGLHCSANERRADEASRDVEAWLKCQYMREHLGEDFSGTVSGVTAFGVFVTLDAMYVEGLVHITELGGDYFKFDETRQELRGERTGIRYSVGARVRVQVSRVDLDGRKIDFRWVPEEGAASVDKPLRSHPSSPRKSGRSQNRSSKNAVKNVSKSSPPAAKVAVKKNAANAKQKTKSRR